MTDFGPNHYVPALKMKRAEKKALPLVSSTAKVRLTPLFEIVESKGKEIARHVDTGMRGLSPGTDPLPRFFLDAGELEPDGVLGARRMFDVATDLKLKCTPVTGPARFDLAIARAHGGALALRLTRRLFEGGTLSREVSRCLEEEELDASQIDLILDAGDVSQMVPIGVAQLFAQMMRVLPDIVRWRTLTALSCGFPGSISAVKTGDTGEILRRDWLAWRNELYERRATLKRLPTFGDYAIQNIKGVEGFDPRTMQASAAIRYTLADSWLIVKGAGTKKSPAAKQSIGLAKRLVTHSKFMGAKHCVACQTIAAAATGKHTVTTLEEWRRLGTVHHLEVAGPQIAALTWP